MAVKILSEGNHEKYKIQCFICNSLLEFTNLDEVSIYCPDIPFEGSCTDYSIKCPVCNHNVPVRTVTDIGYYDWRTRSD